MRKVLPVIAMAMVSLVCGAAEFCERDVVVRNESEDISLAGTLTAPGSGTPRALLVMATGSGQQNRDEEIMGHKPFKVIAEYLSERGYAVLRMDDRGIGGSEGDFAVSTVDDFTSDIKSGIKYVRSQYPGVSTGVIGHSEGGSVAILAGCGESPAADFIITLAAPAWAGDSIIMSQSRAIAMGMMGKWKNEPLQRRILDLVKSPMETEAAHDSICGILVKSVGSMANIRGVKEQIAAQTAEVLSPNYRRMIRYNPETDIKAVAVPWLALNGSKDCQVLVGNLATIKDLNPNVETQVMENHNHLFQQCSTGLVSEYQLIKEDISEQTLAAIAEWLDSVFPKK
jgi:hypothetical protein